MPLRARDFESRASASSATPALLQMIKSAPFCRHCAGKTGPAILSCEAFRIAGIASFGQAEWVY